MPITFSCSTVFNRATSLRITRKRSGSSSVRVPDANVRLNLSRSSSAMRLLMSASLISRMSLANIRMRLLTCHELRLHSDLGRGQRHRLASDLRRYALELEHHPTRLHHRHPPFRRALSFSHAGLSGLLGDRLVREDPDPDFTTALDVSRQSHASRLDLPVGNPTRLHRLQAVVPERHLVATCSEALRPALEPLSELYALGTEHFCFLSSDASRVGLAAAILDDLALEDPDLHTNGAEGGLGGRSCVIDVRAQRMKGHTALVISLDASDLGAAEAPAAFDLDSASSHAHRALHRTLHGATEGDALRQLVGDVVGDELRVELGTLDLFDIDPDLLSRQSRQLVAELIDFGALLTDDDARTTGVNRHDDLARLALDADVGNRRVTQSRLEILAQQLVFPQKRREVAVGVPLRSPRLGDAKAKPDRMCFLTH